MESFYDVKLKRERGENFSVEEKTLLVSWVAPRIGIIESRASDAESVRQKKAVWVLIASAFADAFPDRSTRTVDKLKMLWRRLKKDALTDSFNERQGEGGSSGHSGSDGGSITATGILHRVRDLVTRFEDSHFGSFSGTSMVFNSSMMNGGRLDGLLDHLRNNLSPSESYGENETGGDNLSDVDGENSNHRCPQSVGQSSIHRSSAMPQNNIKGEGSLDARDNNNNPWANALHHTAINGGCSSATDDMNQPVAMDFSRLTASHLAGFQQLLTAHKHSKFNESLKTVRASTATSPIVRLTSNLHSPTPNVNSSALHHHQHNGEINEHIIATVNNGYNDSNGPDESQIECNDAIKTHSHHLNGGTCSVKGESNGTAPDKIPSELEEFQTSQTNGLTKRPHSTNVFANCCSHCSLKSPQMFKSASLQSRFHLRHSTELLRMERREHSARLGLIALKSRYYNLLRNEANLRMFHAITSTNAKGHRCGNPKTVHNCKSNKMVPKLHSYHHQSGYDSE